MTSANITAWKTVILGKVMEIQARYRMPVMWVTVADDTLAQYKLAASFQTEARRLNNISADLKRESVDIALDLHELRYAAMNYPATGYLPSELVQNVVDKLCAPLLWLVRTGEPVLVRQELIHQVAKGVTNLPKDAFKWSLEQILGALNLPTWMLPVLGAGAIGGVAWWSYNTFLAPVGRGVRAARAVREVW